MNIQYNKKKEEMRDDPVVSAFVKAKEYVTKNATVVLTVLVVVAMVAVGYGAYNSMKRSSIARAQEAFGNAMVAYTSGNKQKAVDAFSTIAENYGNSPQGGYAAYLLGTILVEEQRYDEATRWLEMAGSRLGTDNVVKGLAFEELGTIYERTGDLAKASEYLTKSLSLNAVDYRWPSIRWKLALLHQKQGNSQNVEELCQTILGDTTAVAYKDKAENLLTELRMRKNM